MAGIGYEKGRRRRSELLEAAFSRFATLGYRNATLAQIAADCGVSRMGLAHHFRTKEALLLAVLEERDRVNGRDFFVGSEPSVEPLDYLDRFARLIDDNAAVPGLINLYAVLSAESATDPDHPAHGYFRDRYRRIRGHIDAAFAALKADGTIDARVDVDNAGAAMMGLIDGLQVQWLLEPDAVDIGAQLRRWYRQGFGLDLA